ncbi:uncharacterized protein LOC119732553 [Patiria miniata]|uniref:G-protein coupled receptors family 1 profile domain-containing protein n=1 Tax=Patiria miniata TaxID=46514 RepID=A0A914ADN5_PATMI|nr:uncharacterized protein LOC119732553 [Patiria miniata]
MDAEASFNSTGDTSPGDIAHATVVILIGILVSFCSFLTILAVHKFRSVSNPDILILALAIIDFISSFTVFPLAAFWYLKTVAYPTELCLVYGALTTTIQLASTAVVSLMTVDRFLAIRRPILYRTRLGSPQLKRLVIIMVVISAVIGCLPAALSSTTWTTVTNRHGYCTFQYSSDFTFVILALSLPQIPLLLYCYYGFLVSIRKFIKRRQSGPVPSPASSSVSSSELGRRNHTASPPGPTVADRWEAWEARCRIYCCCCCCSVCRAKQTKPASREEMVERTQTMMKNLNLKRCTRMSKTVALVVVIYYIPWLLTLITMTIELITRVDNYSSTLSLITVRLMMAHSILYPMVYATLCGNYRQAYKWALSLPFHPCGLEWHERPPLGISVSEMHRISHQMALEEWESPGLNRRLYSKRPYLKRSTTDSLKDTPNAEGDAGRDNPAFEGNEMTSSDQTAELDGHITVEIVHERAPVEAPANNPTPSVSVHRVAHADTPPLSHRPRRREDKKQGSCAPRRPLENQTSDSGVDVDSIHLDSAPSGSNSPAVIRLQTVESESSTSVSDATEHLTRADDSHCNETSFIQTSGQEGSSLPQGRPQTGTPDGVCGHIYTRLQSVAKDRVTSDRNAQHINTANARTEHDDAKAGQRDVIVQNDDAIEIDDLTAKNATVNTEMLETLSKGYSIKETLPGRNSVLRVEPCSAGDQSPGLVRIHVEVVELRPDSPPLAHDTCTLQSSTKQCRIKSANQKPSLKFSMQKNRFVPCTSSFEETESYSFGIDGQDVEMSKDIVPTPRLNLPDADDSSKYREPPEGDIDNEIMATNGDLDENQLSDEPPAKGFKSRRMRASRALRESARYDDDIVRYSEMMMRKQKADKTTGKQETPKTGSMESLLVPDRSHMIVTDHIDL